MAGACLAPALLLSAALCFLAPVPAHAVSTLHTMVFPGRTDAVLDMSRSGVYVASGDRIVRWYWNVSGNGTPLVLGGDLKGVDISADGRSLAVTDAAVLPNGKACVRIVDLSTDRARTIEFDRASDAEQGMFWRSESSKTPIHL